MISAGFALLQPIHSVTPEIIKWRMKWMVSMKAVHVFKVLAHLACIYHVAFMWFWIMLKWSTSDL